MNKIIIFFALMIGMAGCKQKAAPVTEAPEIQSALRFTLLCSSMPVKSVDRDFEKVAFIIHQSTWFFMNPEYSGNQVSWGLKVSDQNYDKLYRLIKDHGR